jgi:hypothetical protein
MICCEFCGILIETNELNKHYKITLGNVVSGKFYGKKNVFYHKECLNSLKKANRELIPQIY